MLLEKILTLFCYFVIYSFVGWICETVFCSIPAKRFINRGFLNGPFCPIYGFGAVLVLVFFTKYKNDIVTLFVMSTVVTSIVEYVTSYLLEKIFHLSLWDYSKRKANINGRVCLRNSLLFGVMSVLTVEFIHPWVERFLALWPPLLLVLFTGFLVLYFISDVFITVRALLQINREAGRRQMQLEELTALRDQVIEKMQVEKQQKKKKKLQNLHARLIRAFPNMESKRYPEAVEQMKKEILEEIAKRKANRHKNK